MVPIFVNRVVEMYDHPIIQKTQINNIRLWLLERPLWPLHKDSNFCLVVKLWQLKLLGYGYVKLARLLSVEDKVGSTSHLSL